MNPFCKPYRNRGIFDGFTLPSLIMNGIALCRSIIDAKQVHPSLKVEIKVMTVHHCWIILVVLKTRFKIICFSSETIFLSFFLKIWRQLFKIFHFPIQEQYVFSFFRIPQKLPLLFRYCYSFRMSQNIHQKRSNTMTQFSDATRKKIVKQRNQSLNFELGTCIPLIMMPNPSQN